jgi:hypothetical protein
MSSGPVLAAVAALRAAYTELAALPVDALTHPELLTVLDGLESLNRQLPTQSHRIIARLAAEASPTQLGAKNLREVLTQRLMISKAEATRDVQPAPTRPRASAVLPAKPSSTPMRGRWGNVSTTH